MIDYHVKLGPIYEATREINVVCIGKSMLGSIFALYQSIPSMADLRPLKRQKSANYYKRWTPAIKVIIP